MMLVLLKWNGEMLVKWLSEQFWRYCSYIYVLIETADERHACCLCNVGKQNRASAPFIQNMQDSYLNQLLQIQVHITIWFKCNNLLLMNSSKLWHSITFRVKLNIPFLWPDSVFSASRRSYGPATWHRCTLFKSMHCIVSIYTDANPWI